MKIANLILEKRNKRLAKRGIHLGKSGSFFFRNEFLTDAQINHHVHIVGASGFGKTVLLSHIVKDRISKGKGFLFIDQKGDRETIELFTRFVEDAGRLQDLKVFSLEKHNSSSSYNLLANGSATELRDRIMAAFVWSEEFYKNQAASFLLRLLTGLVWLRTNRDLKVDIALVLKCMASAKEIELLLQLIPLEQKREWELFDEARVFIKSSDSSKTLQGLRTQLESVVYSDFGEGVVAKENGLDLYQTVRSGKIAFIFLDTRRFGLSATAVGRFVIQDLKSVSARIDAEIPKSDRRPFTVVIDEFADLAQDDFISFLDRARSSKIGIVLAHQEITDLDRISPQFCGRLMGNTATLFAFLQKRPESAELISGIAGTRRARVRTVQHERFMFMSMPSGMSSVKEVEEFVIHPNEIKGLKVGECVRVSKYPVAGARFMRVRPEN